ncbi:hypothetical protein [Burkholderia cenocepacia]|uniref:hypothetical protein n=1 Tax=Burkholderia cenocepacia TaxID=95486 RepID=UPI00076D6C43|nr:hypothetical protein [Burkholderia cenocepacia]KWU26426.1 hypothetical protein AS149_25905 [Burkholderia cenocepacia]
MRKRFVARFSGQQPKCPGWLAHRRIWDNTVINVGVGMGEAKRRRAEIDALKERNARLGEAAGKVGHALRRLATAASGNLGSDCFAHAVLGQALLADLGFNADIEVGEAAWRIGPGDGDVISHTFRENSFTPAQMSPEQRAIAFHAWLVVDETVVDFTTYQLASKAQMLDEADGRNTTVEWCPEILVLPKQRVATYRQTAQSLKSGVAYYGAQEDLRSVVTQHYSLDAHDLNAARILLANPEARAFGPNNTGA